MPCGYDANKDQNIHNDSSVAMFSLLIVNIRNMFCAITHLS